MFQNSGCDFLKWLTIFDNPMGRFPRGAVLTQVKNFIAFMKEYTEVETIIVDSQGQFYGVEIKHVKSETAPFDEKTISSNPVDGVVISMTEQAVKRLIENPKHKKEFFDILKRLKKDAPIIFCTGKYVFNDLIATNILRDLNVVFQRKMKFNWFNIHLKNTVRDHFEHQL